MPQFVEGSAPRQPTPAGRRGRRTDAESARVIERPRSIEAARSADRSSEVEQVYPQERNETVSRIFNVVVASVGFIIAFPICLIVALLVRFTSRGPILYAQTRVGMDRRWRETLALHERRMEDLGGQVFTIYKFRTMRVDAEQKSGAVWALENDPRVTSLGRYMRKWRLDELPQLWNIIRGDMNIVGPRPERPSIVARLREDIPEYQFRHRVKPGLTGLAQINQKYDACLDDVRGKVGWDLSYLKSQSLRCDIVIMLKTVPSVLLKFQGW